MDDGRRPDLGPPRKINKVEIPEAFRYQYAVDPSKHDGQTCKRLPTGIRILDALLII